MGFLKLQNLKDFEDAEWLLERNLPSSSQMLTLIRLGKRYSSSDLGEIHFFLYQRDDNADRCLENEIFSPNCVITYTSHKPSEDMMLGLEKIVDWKNVKLFALVNEKLLAPGLEKLIKKHLPSAAVEAIPATAFYMDPKNIKEKEFPLGHNFRISRLNENFTSEIIKNWSWAKPHCHDPVRQCLKLLPSTGIFSDDKLISSGMMSAMGLINVVYTEEEWRGKGLGAATIIDISKQIASLGCVPVAETQRSNSPSKALLQKVGFLPMMDTIWYFI